jgi:hypothetical protein
MGVCLFFYALTTHTLELAANTVDKIVSVLEKQFKMAEAHDKILAVTVEKVLTHPNKDDRDKNLDNK